MYYNRAKIMKQAWSFTFRFNWSLSTAMKEAWKQYKLDQALSSVIKEEKTNVISEYQLLKDNLKISNPGNRKMKKAEIKRLEIKMINEYINKNKMTLIKIKSSVIRFLKDGSYIDVNKSVIFS